MATRKSTIRKTKKQSQFWNITARDLLNALTRLGMAAFRLWAVS